MKRIVACIFATTVGLYFVSIPGYAQGRGGGHAPAVESHAVAHGADHDGHGKDADHDKTNTGPHSNETHPKTPIVDRIDANPALKAKVTSLLPAGMDLKTASSGFRNEGQFIAALHVSKNLGIPFADLKAKMTGPNHESLGQAIHDLKPGISEQDSRKDAETAEKEAKANIKTKPLT
jgi:hypothetical protein